ncbi:protein DOG1-like 3 [Lolium rigidum]|uniref:protein DOG1-like 3 n=1 Tax=Lolium rigidum TaxID=89674 RepID=UPI001F5CC225|nr:protein DOG1-like 3 [Lolium rigidum]
MDLARYAACHRQWIAGQEAGLAELVAAAASAAAGRTTDEELSAVVERCMRGYEEYATSRRAMAREDGAAFFAPPWCTAFENAVLWLGGCRPSLTVRLLYSLSGEGMEAHIEELVGGRGRGRGEGTGMGLLGITPAQLDQINDLHNRTLREEGLLTDRLATLQEDIADRPLLPIIRERERAAAAAAAALAARHGGANSNGLPGRLEAGGSFGGVDAEVDAAMESYRAGLAKLLEEADELRLSTARALATQILTPRQAVEMLVAGKQLHLSVRDWSRRQEREQNARLPRASTSTSSGANP